MLGHYLGLYKYADHFPVDNVVTRIFDKLLESDLNFIVNESFWVILFFVVSGYLVAMTKIQDIKIFIKKSSMRFLRLGIPILCSMLMVFALYKVVGFHTVDTIGLFDNSFVQGAYNDNFKIIEALLSPINVLILGKVSLNSPFWVLREMFFTSLIIYFLQFLYCKIKKNSIFLSIVGVVFFTSMILSNVVFAGIFGYIINLIEKNKENKITTNKIFIFLAIIFSVSLYFIPRSRISCIFFGCLILLIPKLPFICSIFSSKLAQYINKISFGIYAFHWPVFCSIGMLCLIKFSQNTGLLTACIISYAIAVLTTILISVCFYHFIEKWIYILLKKFDIKIGEYIK